MFWKMLIASLVFLFTGASLIALMVSSWNYQDFAGHVAAVTGVLFGALLINWAVRGLMDLPYLLYWERRKKELFVRPAKR